MEFFTIGVFNSTEDEFFEKLIKNQIDTFCDIRQRRGVRGSKYSFVNSNRLQYKLNQLEIKYGYIPELAPTTEIRELQKEIDLEKRVSKKERKVLDMAFIIEYKNKILDKFNFDAFFEKLEYSSSNRIVFFCVEEFPDACHRSIISEVLSERFHYNITHL